MNKVLKVKCPSCEKEFNYYSSDFRPFCCERCKQIDLGHWLTESYTVPGKPAISENDLNEFEADEDFFVDENE